MNAQSGLFTLEVVGGLALLAYGIYKAETSDPLGGLEDEWDEYQQEQQEEAAAAALVQHYRDILAGGIPHAGSGAYYWQQYTEASRYVVAHTADFTPEEVGKANSWLQYLTQQGSDGSGPPPEQAAESPQEMVEDALTTIINGPYPDGTTNEYAIRFTRASIVVIEPDMEGSYSVAVRERANRWYYWLQYPNTPKPLGSATNPDAREHDTVNVPPPAGEARPGSGHDPSELHEHFQRERMQRDIMAMRARTIASLNWAS